MDVVRFNSDFGARMVTKRRDDHARPGKRFGQVVDRRQRSHEAVNLLAAKTDWDLAEDIAKRFLRMSALKSLAKLGVTR